MCVGVCKCDECSFFNYCINMDFESVNKDLFNDMCINHVLYADDICLLAPTASAMQTLLDVCYEYGIDNDIFFNPIKSVCTVFKPKAIINYIFQQFSLALML